VTDRTELKRLILQIERDLLVQASLRSLLAPAPATVAGHRQELRTLKARIKRDSTKPPGVLLGGRVSHQPVGPFPADAATANPPRSPGQDEANDTKAESKATVF
jgi:hypothetical protein